MKTVLGGGEFLSTSSGEIYYKKLQIGAFICKCNLFCCVATFSCKPLRLAVRWLGSI